MEAFFSTEFLSSQMALACQVDKNKLITNKHIYAMGFFITEEQSLQENGRTWR